jgi:hypothetical protein
MNLYFFFKNESTESWYDCTIEAWEENDNTYIDGKRVSSFSMLERMHIHACKRSPRFHSIRLDHDYATDSCLGHHAKDRNEFLKEKTENNYQRMDETTHRTFQRFKKVMLKIYNSYPAVNYTSRLLKDAPACRILT